MQEMSSDEARRNFRHVLNDAANGKPTTINRYSEPVAVVVPVEWYILAEATFLERATRPNDPE